MPVITLRHLSFASGSAVVRGICRVRSGQCWPLSPFECPRGPTLNTGGDRRGPASRGKKRSGTKWLSIC